MVFGVLRAEIGREAAHTLHVDRMYRRMDESQRICHGNAYFFEILDFLGQKKAKSHPDVKTLLFSKFVLSTTQRVFGVTGSNFGIQRVYARYFGGRKKIL